VARKSCTSSPDMFSSFLTSPPENERLDRLLGFGGLGSSAGAPSERRAGGCDAGACAPAGL
jgi:hypothetical protein